MKKTPVHISEKNYSLFIKPVKNSNFIKQAENEEPDKEKILIGIRQAVKEVTLIKAGKLKGNLAKDLLNEL